jgi:dTDP-4-dehydrorhamnose reductase
MKILLLGKQGQVANALQRSLQPHGEVFCVGRNELDIADLAKLQAYLKLQDPDVIVNAAAYTAVDLAQTESAKAYQINAQAVELLAHHAAQRQALLIHYSTDYVFDGSSQNAYHEEDATNPQNVYGSSKLAGEQAILKSGCVSMIFRTSWVYSAHGNNFIKTILKHASQKDQLRVVADQWGVPTSADLIADVTSIALARYRFDPSVAGLYHLTPAGKTNWLELARFVVQYATKLGIPLKTSEDRIQAITSADYPTPAQRPKNSLLSSQKLETTFHLQLPQWQTGVQHMLNQLFTSFNMGS